MNSDYNFQYTETAETDLDGIIEYITNNLANKKAASDFLDETEKAIQEILQYPEACPKVSNEFLIHSEIRKKLVKNFILFYKADHKNKMITIVRILYAKRDIKEIIRYI